jgi:hypothetical protein
MDIFKETPDFTIMTGFLPYFPISYTTQFKTRTCAHFQLLVSPENITKLQYNKDFITTNYKVRVCILHASICCKYVEICVNKVQSLCMHFTCMIPTR